MSQSIMIFGVPMEIAGMPYISAKVDKPIPTGEIFTINDVKYEVYEAAEVTGENQLQYVYVRKQEGNEPNEGT